MSRYIKSDHVILLDDFDNAQTNSNTSLPREASVTKTPVREQVITLHKTEGEYGFSFESSYNFSDCGIEWYDHYVTKLAEDGVAAKAGLRFGDKITRVNNRDIGNMRQNSVNEEISKNQFCLELSVVRIVSASVQDQQISDDVNFSLSTEDQEFMKWFVGHWRKTTTISLRPVTNAVGDVGAVVAVAGSAAEDSNNTEVSDCGMAYKIKIAEKSDGWFAESVFGTHDMWYDGMCLSTLFPGKKEWRTWYWRPDGVFRDGRRHTIVNNRLEIENERWNSFAGFVGVKKLCYEIDPKLKNVNLLADGRKVGGYNRFEPISEKKHYEAFCIGIPIGILFILYVVILVIYVVLKGM